MSIFGGGRLASGGCATKDYDRRKPVITVWAEERGSLAVGNYEWSFGNGAVSADGGYPMLVAGRVLRMGFTAVGGASINIVVNGVENTQYGLIIPPSKKTATTIFSTPLELEEGDRINFRTAATSTRTTAAVVSLLIELDLEVAY